MPPLKGALKTAAPSLKSASAIERFQRRVERASLAS
jgi:hypothetical protein